MNKALNIDSLRGLAEDFRMIRVGKGLNLPTVVYETGLTFKQIENIENANIKFNFEAACKLANFYNMTLSVVLDYDVIDELDK